MRKIVKYTCVIMAFCMSQAFLGQGETTDAATKSFKHDGMDRNYLIHLPSNYDAKIKLPLVLNFHGYGSNAKEQMLYTDFNSLSEQENFIVVYPDGTMLKDKTHWNVGGWTLASKTNDVDFIEKLIDFLVSEYSIDDKRIYATGMSNGGYMSFLLGCSLSDKIAAIASVTGSMTPQTFKKCEPQHPMPVLQFHGTTDETVPYEGNPLWTLSMKDVVHYWTEFNKTDSTPDMKAIENKTEKDGFTVEYYSYTNSTNDVEVGHYKVKGGKHEWFGARGEADINTSKIIWEFFKGYNIDGKID